MDLELEGTLHSINLSSGGVPKLPRQHSHVRISGLDGDAQGDRRYHGGPDRAVCLYSLDLIQALRAEGHPIEIGSTGENLTVAGLDWSVVGPGVRFIVGAVVLEVTEPAPPCKKISGAFTGGSFDRISARIHPGWSRMYARVLRGGAVAVGDRIQLMRACPLSAVRDGAESRPGVQGEQEA